MSSSARSDSFETPWCSRLMTPMHVCASDTRSANSAATRKRPPNCAARSMRNLTGRELYLAELFLGREEETLGRRDDAKRRHTNKRLTCYPSAQSPRLALSRLARHTGDRAGAQQLAAQSRSGVRRDPSDPWWEFYESHKEDADAWWQRMRQIGR